MKKTMLILSAMLVIFTGRCEAEEFFSDETSEIDYTALNVNENKVYFPSDQVTLSNQGIYVLVSDINGSFIRVYVSELQHDTSGLFITLENFQRQFHNNRK